jgi:hypothetical protein
MKRCPIEFYTKNTQECWPLFLKVLRGNKRNTMWDVRKKIYPDVKSFQDAKDKQKLILDNLWDFFQIIRAQRESTLKSELTRLVVAMKHKSVSTHRKSFLKEFSSLLGVKKFYIILYTNTFRGKEIIVQTDSHNLYYDLLAMSWGGSDHWPNGTSQLTLQDNIQQVAEFLITLSTVM